MTYLIDAWLDRPQPYLRILDRNTGAVCVSLEGEALEELRDAIARFSPKLIVGASGFRTRHGAMEAGEALPDYLFFGRLSGAPSPSAEPEDLELAAWWASIVELPCVVMGGGDIETADAIGHADVGDHMVEALPAFEQRDRLVPVGGTGGIEPEVGQHFRDQVAQVGFVLDEQDLAPGHQCSRAGRWMVTAVPCPGSLRRWTKPPDCDAKPKTWLSPRPLPCPTSLVVKNGSNTRW